MPPAEYHATLGPSAAKRWINCPASVSLGAGVEKTTSKYAEAGRTAHELAELKARKRFTPMNKRTYTSQLKKIQAGEFYASEMEGYTDLYVEVLEQHAMSFAAPPFIALETAVPIGAYTSELKPDGSPATGTADCIQIGGDTLWITDYKNGSGVPVDADHNPQMQLYALGALQLYAPVYGDMIRTVRMTIVQPALKSVSDFEIGRAELEAWGREVVIPAAARATSADPGAPCPGEWCRFCPVEHTCRARAEKNLALEAFGFAQPANGEQVVAGDTRLLTDAEIGDILRRGADLLAWYSGLKDYALQACLDGREITGFKAVEGRGSREWDNLDAAFRDLQARGIAEALLWERKPATVAGLEKAIGKASFAQLAGDHIRKAPGKPTLVEASDKRPPYNAAQIAFGAVSDGT